MADAFLQAIEARRSIYSLSDESPISDERIHEIVDFAIKFCPSSFNVQSARAVILLGEQHKKLWDMGDEIMKKGVPEQVYQGFLAPRIKGFKAGYGSVSPDANI
jgi:predicted oxidoreductase (fatty acid repression mutant protein)